MTHPEQIEKMVEELHGDFPEAIMSGIRPWDQVFRSALTKAFQLGIEASEKEVKNIYGGSAHRLLQALAHLKEPRSPNEMK